jgi:mono/diheme cytochrome c family protein
MSTRSVLILLNLVMFGAVLAYIVYRVLSLRRNPEVAEPENLTPFFDDDVMEGAHLERALGVALVALVILVLGLVAYFIWEPFRSADAKDTFKEQSVERGAVLFANDQSENYNSTVSLLCANCHGVDGSGGSASYTLKSTDPSCKADQVVNEELAATQPQCLPQQVTWQAPSLQLASLRYSRAQLHEIITYGRPGTPMPAWGVKSGRGALNEQSINDLVNYVESIAITPDQAKKDADISVTRKKADAAVKSAKDTLTTAQDALAALPATALAADRADAEAAVQDAQEKLVAALAYQAKVDNPANEGQVLFENNCARCHTRGWSAYDPLDPASPQPEASGGGAYGPNLRDGDVDDQFPPPDGEDKLFAWITEGVPAGQGYGLRGISSGRMPHFGAVLTKSQICLIMGYERNIENSPDSRTVNKDCVA